jgi:hypothetical protein
MSMLGSAVPLGVSALEGLVYPFIHLAIVAMWVYALADMFRNPELSGAAKAMWLLIIVLVPIFGAVIYLAVRNDW